MIFVGSPGFAVIVLSHSIRNIQVDDCLLQVVKVRFIRKLRIVVSYDDQAIITVLVMPFSQRGNYVPAINSTKGPHVDGYNFASQVGQS